MGLFKRNKGESLEEIVWTLAVGGLNVSGESMAIKSFIDDLVKKYKIPYPYYNVCENILAYANNLNALKAFLDLRDKDLQRQLIAGIRSPGLFIEAYKIPKKETYIELVENGLQALVDRFPHQTYFELLNPKTCLEQALMFLGMVTAGEYDTDDISITDHFSLVVFTDLKSLPDRIKPKLQILGLS